jgi:BASS family bile acid:Na+ symporter
VTVERLINVLVTVTLFEMMVAVGLGATLGELLAVARNGRLLIGAALANYVCVPAASVGLLLLFDAQPMVAVGFLILAVCPGAPYGPPFSAIARGDLASAVGLMVLLAGSSALFAPILLQFLVPLVGGDEPIDIDAGKIIVTLLVTQLLPLCIGVAIRQWRSRLADRLRTPATQLSKVLNLSAVVAILAVHNDLLLETPPRAFIGMLALLIASWVAGWLCGGPGQDLRKTMTLTTSLRNVGVGLVIATGSFAGTPAVTAVLVYGMFEVAGSLLLALAWARQKRAPIGDVDAGKSTANRGV